MANKINLSELIILQGGQHIIIGNSGSGKTFFALELIKQLKYSDPLYVFGNDQKEWDIPNIRFLTTAPFRDNFLFTLSDCIVIFDDYRQEKSDDELFYRFVNYHVRHNNICFILITHSIFKSNLYSKILSSQSIFLTSSSSNLFFAQKYDKMFDTNVTNILKQNIQESSETHRPVLYITPHFLINSVEELINPTGHEKKVKMFKHDKTYYLLDVTKYKFEEKSDKKSSGDSQLQEILAEFEEMYPVRFKKLKKLIRSLYEFLVKHNGLNASTEIEVGKTKMSFYDFVISSQDFSKKGGIDTKVKAVLSYLRKNGFKVPRFTVQNQLYRSYIT